MYYYWFKILLLFIGSHGFYPCMADYGTVMSGKASNLTVPVPSQYVVYPNSPSEVQVLEHAINTLFHQEDARAYRSLDKRIEFWVILMTESQLRELTKRVPSAEVYINRKIAGPQDVDDLQDKISSPVDASMNYGLGSGGINITIPELDSTWTSAALNESDPAIQDGETEVDARDFIQCQRDAPIDLKVVSWPITRMLASNLRCYSYDDRGGQYVVLYVIENGIANDPTAQNPVSIPDVTTKLQLIELYLGI